jgi:hypothetical protein
VLDAADNTEVTSLATDLDKLETSEAATEVMLVPASTDVIKLESSGNTELDCEPSEDNKLVVVGRAVAVVLSPSIDERMESVAPAKKMDGLDGSRSVVLLSSVGV